MIFCGPPVFRPTFRIEYRNHVGDTSKKLDQRPSIQFSSSRASTTFLEISTMVRESWQDAARRSMAFRKFSSKLIWAFFIIRSFIYSEYRII